MRACLFGLLLLGCGAGAHSAPPAPSAMSTPTPAPPSTPAPAPNPATTASTLPLIPAPAPVAPYGPGHPQNPDGTPRPLPGAVWPPPGGGWEPPPCQLETATAIRRRGSVYEVSARIENLTDEPLEVEMPDRCPQGPAIFHGLPEGYDWTAL